MVCVLFIFCRTEISQCFNPETGQIHLLPIHRRTLQHNILHCGGKGRKRRISPQNGVFDLCLPLFDLCIGQFIFFIIGKRLISFRRFGIVQLIHFIDNRIVLFQEVFDDIINAFRIPSGCQSRHFIAFLQCSDRQSVYFKGIAFPFVLHAVQRDFRIFPFLPLYSCTSCRRTSSHNSFCLGNFLVPCRLDFCCQLSACLGGIRWIQIRFRVTEGLLCGVQIFYLIFIALNSTQLAL